MADEEPKPPDPPASGDAVSDPEPPVEPVVLQQPSDGRVVVKCPQCGRKRKTKRPERLLCGACRDEPPSEPEAAKLPEKGDDGRTLVTCPQCGRQRRTARPERLLCGRCRGEPPSEPERAPLGPSPLASDPGAPPAEAKAADAPEVEADDAAKTPAAELTASGLAEAIQAPTPPPAAAPALPGKSDGPTPLMILAGAGVVLLLSVVAGVAALVPSRAPAAAPTTVAPPPTLTLPPLPPPVPPRLPAATEPAPSPATEPRPAPAPAPPRARFTAGVPALPVGDAAAVEVAEAYDAERPDDVEGRLSLYEQLSGRRLSDGESRKKVHARLTELQAASSAAAQERFTAALEAAKPLLRAEDWDGALTVLADARARLPERSRGLVDRQTETIEQARAQAYQLSAAAAALPDDPPGAPDAALLRRLGQLVADARDARWTRAGKALRERAQALRERAFEAQRQDGERRLKEIEAAVAARDAARAEGWRERARQALETSSKRPINVFGADRYVCRLTEEGFELADFKGATSIGLRLGNRPELGAQVLGLACRPGQAEDVEELALFCLKNRLFDPAKRAAERLAKLDAARAKRLPDVAALRRAARPFRGDPLDRPPQGVDGAVYDFRSKEAALLLEDFEAAPEGAAMQVGPDGLTIVGPRGALAAFEEVSCVDQATLEVDWPLLRRTDAIVEVRLDVTGKNGTSVALYLRDQGGRRMIRLFRSSAGGAFEPVGDWFDCPGSRVTLGLGSGLATVVGTAGRCNVPRFSQVRVCFLALPEEGFAASVAWPRFAFSGALRPEWRQKSLAAYGDLLWRELLRDPGDQGALAAGSPLPSVDDAFALADLDAAGVTRWEAQWRELRADPARAAAAFERSVRERPDHASAWFGRAVARLEGPEPWSAVADLDRALELEPDFPEALVARAELRVRTGDDARARTDLARALRRAPDLAVARRLEGIVALHDEAFVKARDAFGLAVALDPQDALARRFFAAARQVVAGPPWEKTSVVETDHFTVSTDLPPAKAKRVGELLERGRVAYAAVVGTRAASRGPSPRKASCLVFDTAEGFHTYAALLRLGDADARVLGLYFPTYKQLLFFEDRNDTTGKALEEVLFHEAFHRYADEVMPGLPIWLNEGLAEVFGGELTYGGGGLLEGRLADLEDALAGGRAPSVAALVRMPNATFSGPSAPVHYAMSWALARYLVRGPAPASAKAALTAYLALLREGRPPDEAWAATFRGVDLAALEVAWRAWVPTLRER